MHVKLPHLFCRRFCPRSSPKQAGGGPTARFPAASFLAIWFLAACSPQAPDLLATYEAGDLRLAELDAHIRTQPEARRLAPQDKSREAWLEEQVRDAAFQEILAASQDVRARLESAESQARRSSMIVEALAAAVLRDLSAQIVVADVEVQSRVEEAQATAEPEPLYDFRHVFLRLDRATDEAGRAVVRRRAAEVARRAREGDDFGDLVKQYSESSAAADGGMIRNQRPRLLDGDAAEALSRLDEGEVSPVIETRTGLHIFRLERRLVPHSPGPEKIEQRIRATLARERLDQARAALTAELRSRFEFATEEFPWRIGELDVDAADVERLAPSEDDPERRRLRVVELLLLAEEGRARGYLTQQLEVEVDAHMRRQAVESAYQSRWREHVAVLDPERLRSFYESRPAAFSVPQMAHLELIFVPQGPDPFATQKRLEGLVAELRAGASFADAAREFSAGPAGEDGGDLGWLPPAEWARLGPDVHGAVAGMEAGEISAPIHLTHRLMTTESQTLRGGFVILRVRAKKPPAPRSFDVALDDIRAAYAGRHRAEIDGELRAATLAASDFRLVRLPAADELVR